MMTVVECLCGRRRCRDLMISRERPTGSTRSGRAPWNRAGWPRNMVAARLHTKGRFEEIDREFYRRPRSPWDSPVRYLFRCESARNSRIKKGQRTPTKSHFEEDVSWVPFWSASPRSRTVPCPDKKQIPSLTTFHCWMSKNLNFMDILH